MEPLSEDDWCIYMDWEGINSVKDLAKYFPGEDVERLKEYFSDDLMGCGTMIVVMTSLNVIGFFEHMQYPMATLYAITEGKSVDKACAAWWLKTMRIAHDCLHRPRRLTERIGNKWYRIKRTTPTNEEADMCYQVGALCIASGSIVEEDVEKDDRVFFQWCLLFYSV